VLHAVAQALQLNDVDRHVRPQRCSKGFWDSMTEEDRNNLVDSLAEQRYAGLGAMASVPTQPGAPSGFAPPNTR
jgi:hypothetical protein